MQRPRSNKNSNSLTKSTNKEAKTKTEVSQSGASPRVGLAVCDETGEELLLLAGPCCGQVLYNPCLHHRTLTPKGHPENTTHDKLLIWHENHTAHTYTRARARLHTNILSLSLSLSRARTQTHTHTHAADSSSERDSHL